MHLGLIGCGNIGASVLARLDPVPERVTVLVRPGGRKKVGRVPEGTEVLEDPAQFIAAGPDLAVECAGHAAVRDVAVAVLRAGIDTVVVSVGALADAGVDQALRDAAQTGRARMMLPAGAIGGIDILSALSAAGGLEVTYTGTKPPAAWKGSPAEEVLDLDALSAAATFFEGTAREAAQAYPKNANVAATLALAGAGFDATRVRLVADPNSPGNSHGYRVRSPLGEYEMQISNNPSVANVRTSETTIYSVLREIRNYVGPVAI